MDAAAVMGPLPDGSFSALLAEHGDRIVRDEDFADCYCERMGRPSIPPSLLAKVLLLQYRAVNEPAPRRSLEPQRSSRRRVVRTTA